MLQDGEHGAASAATTGTPCDYSQGDAATKVPTGADTSALSRPQQRRSQRQRAATFAAFVGFGLASWLMTNVTYVELGIFLRELPEHYSIYAYSILALESANVYPVLYMLLNARRQRVDQAFVIWWLLLQGVVAAVLMSALWSRTADLFGSQHSVAMLALTHLGGMVSTTSSVVFYPYVAAFPPVFTSALATGEGLSGSAAAVLGLLQDPAGAMRFSVSAFYIFCAMVMAVSVAAFAFLQCHSWPAAVRDEAALENTRSVLQDTDTATDDLEQDIQPGSEPEEATLLVWPLLGCQWVLAAFSFGLLPSTMPFVYKKFAPLDDTDVATASFQTTASIASLILNPLASALTTRFRLYYVRSMSLVLVVLASLLLSFAFTSKPLLSDWKDSHGYLLPLLTHIGYLTGCAYTQTMLYLTLKHTDEAQRSSGVARRMYQWNGLATQLGAMAGTAVAFPLVFFREDLFTT